MKKIEIDQAVEELKRRSGTKAEIVLKKRFPGGRLVGGKYSIGAHTITLYIDVIKEQCQTLFHSTERFMEYFAIVAAHEIGHAEDTQLGQLADQLDACSSGHERGEIALKIEENAWEYASRLLFEMDKDFMDQIVGQSLEPYYEKLKMEPA